MVRKSLSTCFAIIAFATVSNAQVNIGSTNPPDASTALQVSGNNLGFLPPKVSLTKTTTFSLTGNTQTPRIIVYNTNDGLTRGTATATGNFYVSYGVGLYIWNGEGWQWLGGKPSFTASSNPATNIPVGTSQSVAIPINSYQNFGTLMPTLSGNNILINKTAQYDFSVNGYIMGTGGASSGDVVIYVYKNGSFSDQISVYIPTTVSGDPFNFSYAVRARAFNAGDVLSFVVASNTTGGIIRFVTITKVGLEEAYQ